MGGLIFSPLLSDGMVIQRDTPFPVWSREKIKIGFLGRTYESQNSAGKWLIKLDPVKAGGPFTMEITTSAGAVTIKDIYAGDVWLCAGQSNMEMMMARLRDDFGEEWRQEFPLVRYFKAPQEWDFSKPREELTGGFWLAPSVENLHEFAGTPWFFAKEMYKKYKIPIGLINTAWGGTPIESWMSEDALASYPKKIEEGRQYADNAKREKITNETEAAIQNWHKNVDHEDTGLAKNWKSAETDISDWKDITLPGDFSGAGLVNFCGALWLAKDFEVSQDFADKESKLWLGTITDSDMAYINGAETGNTGYRYPPRKYVPSGLLKKGKNRIVIRVICNNGDGGVTCGKPFKIFTDTEAVELSGTWKYKIGVTAQRRPAEFFFQRMPMGNYNAMIAPILKYPLKGVIWYQGESNDSSPREYADLFKKMICDWRQKNGYEELPFLFVQLPIWKEPSDNNENSSWALIREAQTGALSLPATGMAAALELGEWNDLHPINKKDVGIRLFLAAEKTLFKAGNTSPGAVFSRFERRDDKLYLFFNNCGKGLCAKNGEKPYITVFDGENPVRLGAEIEGADCISVNLSSIKNPQKILYAWADNPRDRQLFNGEGLPVIPFRAKL